MQKIIDYISASIKSRTMWFNLIVAAMMALEPVFGLLKTVLPGNVYVWCSVALTVGNAVLRVLTTKPLLEK